MGARRPRMGLLPPSGVHPRERVGTLLGLDSPDEFLKLCRDRLSTWIPLYARWAADWLAERTCAVMFCRFLQIPAAAALLPHGLAWLHAHIVPVSFRYERDVSNALGELLVILADTRHEGIVKSPQMLESYRALLSRLTAIEHPRAIEIETLLASVEGL